MTSTITDQRTGDVSSSPVSSGLNGWTALHALVASGNNRFMQLVDWTGGTGDEPTDPAIGSYLGSAGYTTDTGQATNLRGSDGSPGAGTGDMLAANNLSDVGSAATAFANIKQAADTGASGVVEEATVAEYRAATEAKFLDAALIETASALVALSDASTVAIDWDAGINFSLTVAGSRTLGNPTNGQPGTWRTILAQGNNTTDRTFSYASNYLGETPTVTDCDSGRWYLFTIYCVTTSHFVISAKRAKG